MEFKTILVPTDFSEDANVALDAAVEMAKHFGSELHVLHAYTVDVPPVYGGLGGGIVVPVDLLEPVKVAAEGAVEQLVADLVAQGVRAKGRSLMCDASTAVLREAEEIEADLIVMGTRGLTGLKHVWLGSTAERVVRLAACPVLTLKGKH